MLEGEGWKMRHDAFSEGRGHQREDHGNLMQALSFRRVSLLVLRQEIGVQIHQKYQACELTVTVLEGVRLGTL